MSDLAGRTALVTGGATLIGAAVVRGLVRRGARVAIADIDEAGGAALAAEVGEAATFVATDVRDDAQIAAFVAAAAERFDGVDMLVNLACSYVDDGFARRASNGSSRSMSTSSRRR